MSEQAVAAAVVRNDEQHRYEVWYGNSLAGFAEYREREDGDTVFIHTEVDSAFGGKGLGNLLAHDAVTDAIARGRAIVPRCPFIKSWLDKHPEYDEHVVGKGIKR
ncbi:GNAT family N-acetyltransferase [Nocardia crassostreae]|uniref:GNAT family N-acetyltransferase n=1 Tax=Nocardia crassostreae TaxID=53428 RepID=UPI00082E0E46|nr:GNAT family N-acetyltransferase [Nocardia crassostreae]